MQRMPVMRRARFLVRSRPNRQEGKKLEQTDAMVVGPDVSKRELVGLFQGLPTCFQCQLGKPRDCAKPPAGEAIALRQVGEWDRKIPKLEEQLDCESRAEDLRLP